MEEHAPRKPASYKLSAVGSHFPDWLQGWTIMVCADEISRGDFGDACVLWAG